MKYTFFLIPLLVGIAMGILKKQLYKTTHKVCKDTAVTVCLPRYYAIIGIAVTVFFTAISFGWLIFPHFITKEPFWAVCFVSFPFISMGLSIIIATFVWKIQFSRDEDHFLYTTFFGRTYKIYYKDIEYYKFGISTTVLKTEGKRFFAETQSINFNAFFKELKKHKVKSNNESPFIDKLIKVFFKKKSKKKQRDS